MRMLDEARAKYGLQVGAIALGADVFVEAVGGEIDGRPIDGWVAIEDRGMAAAHFVNHMIRTHSGRSHGANAREWHGAQGPGVTVKYLPTSEDVRDPHPVETLRVG